MNLGRLWTVAAVAMLFASSGCAASGYYEAAVEMRTKSPHAAIEYVSLCLAADQNHEKAIGLISELGSRMADEHKARIEQLERSQAWEDAVAQCDRMAVSCDVVAKLPHGIQIYHDPDERHRFAKRAAKKFYDQGLKLEGQGGQAKEAAIAFRRATGFVTNYEDAAKRYQANQGSATVRVAVMGFESLAPNARKLCDRLAKGTQASCVAKNPEFLQVVSASQVDTCQGKLLGTIQSATFEDSGWIAHPDKNEGTKTVKDEDTGLTREVKISAKWTVYDRKTHYKLTASFNVENTKTGAAMGAATASAEAGDGKRYVEISGDEDAVPAGVKELPRKPVDPKGEDLLADGCAESVAEQLGLELFRALK